MSDARERTSETGASQSKTPAKRARTKKVYAVTLRSQCEMVVWIEAYSAKGAKVLADAGEYEVMTDWSPVDYWKVRSGRARPSTWPES